MYVRPTNRRLPYSFRNGDGPESYHIVCGFLGCDSRPFNPVLAALPRQFCARLSAAARSWLLSMLRVAAEQSEFGGAGSETMLAKFAEVMFVEVIRNYVAQLPEHARLAFRIARPACWAGAAADPWPAGGRLGSR
jgi:hypothetical protein